MNDETRLQNRIMNHAAHIPGLRLFRNFVGQAWLGVPKKIGSGLAILHARRVTAGMGVGSGDLIGWQTITVTPDMVGKTVAIFVSAEVKTATGRATKQQKHWVEELTRQGAIAGIVTSAEELEVMINNNRGNLNKP